MDDVEQEAGLGSPDENFALWFVAVSRHCEDIFVLSLQRPPLSEITDGLFLQRNP